MHANSSDIALLQAWQRHRDADAFHTLVARHAQLVFSTCRHILRNDADAADVSQECFLSLATTPPRIERSLAGWLHRLATHRALNHLKKEMRRRDRELRFVAELPDTHTGEIDDLLAVVDSAIDSLPDDLRLPLVDYFLRQKTHQQVADGLAIPRRTVSYRINRGVEEHRAELKRKGVAVPAVGLAALLESKLAGAAQVPVSLQVALGKHALAGTMSSGAGSLSGLLGGLLLAKKGWAVAVVVLGLLATWWLTTTPGLQGPRQPDPLPMAMSQVEESDESAPQDDAPVESAEAIAEGILTAAQITTDTVGKIAGRVFDANTNAPISRATVVIAPRDRTAGHGATCTTNGQGQYTSEALIAGSYLVYRGATPGYPVTSEKNIFADYRNEQVLDGVHVVLTGDATIDFPVHQGLHLRGTVVDKRGRGIAGVDVSAFTSGEDDRQSTQTGPDGTFALTGFSPSQKFAIMAHKAGFGHKNFEDLTLLPPGMDDMRIELPNAASISGTVRDANGHPVANAQIMPVRLPNQYHRPFDYPECRSDAAGNFVLTELGPGGYTFRVFPEHFQFYGQNDMPQVDLREGEQRSGVDLVLELGTGFTVAGTVADTEGAPLSMTYVNISGPRHRTVISDEEGRFFVDGLVEGRYDLVPYKLGYYNVGKKFSNDLVLHADQNEIALVLKNSPLAIYGQVVDDVTNAPIRDFEVTWSLYEPSGEIARYVWASGKRVHSADGAFRFENVDRSKGTCTVYARVPGLGAAFTRLDLPEDETQIEIVVRIPRGITYTGSVVDANGAPVAGAFIVAGAIRRPGLTYGIGDVPVTGEDGTFEATGVSPDTTLLSAVHPLHPITSLPVQPGESHRRLLFEFEATGAITTFVTTDGVPAPSARLSVSSESVPNFSTAYAATTPDGVATFQKLPPGIYKVEITRPNTGTVNFQAQFPASVSANKTTSVPIALSSTTTLGGTVLFDGVPVTAGMAMYKFSSGDMTAKHEFELGAGGVWLLEGVQPGKGTLLVAGVNAEKEDYYYSIELDLALGEARVVDVDLAKVGEGKWPAEFDE